MTSDELEKNKEDYPSGDSLQNTRSSNLATSEADALRTGGSEKLAEFLFQYQPKLERMIMFRMEPALRRRIDSADVLQEAYLEISRRIAEFIDQPGVPFFVWVRQKVMQTLIDLHRKHTREKRDTFREVHLSGQWQEQNTSVSIARHLIDEMTSPSMAAVRAEEASQLESALNTMNETDREILALRHFEQLSNNEVADILAISPTAASNRYVRAAAKLGEILRRFQSTSPS